MTSECILGLLGTASFPGFSLLLRESTLVAAGQVVPKIWEPKLLEREKSNMNTWCNRRYDKSQSVGAPERLLPRL